tara:strand:- start:293212 stop:293973 length:762 start_codon:yes stop_codon:yes gene_type:complete
MASLEGIKFDDIDGSAIAERDLDLDGIRFHPVIYADDRICFFHDQIYDGDDDQFIRRRYRRSSQRLDDCQSYIQLSGGRLFRTSSFERTFDTDKPVKIMEQFSVLLPDGGSDVGFRVLDRKNDEVHEPLTRLFFGMCEYELRQLTAVFSDLFHGREFDQRGGRVTASRTRDNSCDLSNRLIPARFPYVAFANSDHFGGHIAIGTFYDTLSFLCLHPRKSDAYARLLGEGVPEDALRYALYEHRNYLQDELYTE